MSMPATMPINANRVRGQWVLTGGTYTYKESLKSRGCRFDGENRVWTYDGIELPTLIRDLIKDSGGMIAGDVPPAAPAPTPQTIEKVVEKIIEVEKEKIVVKSAGKHIRINRRLALKLPKKVEPVTNAFVKPSYWDDLCMYLVKGDARPVIALVGPAGNGKTSTAEAVLEAIGYEYEVLDATEFIEPADIVGAMSFRQEESGKAEEVWRDGILTKCFRSGKALIINEFDALNPRAAMCLQSAFQDKGHNGRGRYVTLAGNKDESRVYPTGDCPVILTMNTYGTGATRQYVGRNALDAASLDRITVISTGYENEEAILTGRGYGKKTADKLVKWAKKVRTEIDRNEFTVILSNRTLLRMAQTIERFGWTFEKAVQKEFLDRLEPDFRTILGRA